MSVVNNIESSEEENGATSVAAEAEDLRRTDLERRMEAASANLERYMEAAVEAAEIDERGVKKASK